MGLVLVLRITGRRTLSKIHAFDLVVAVALGSALALTMLSKSTPLAGGLAGLGLLVLLQYAVTWISVRSERFQAVFKAQPAILAHRGCWQEAALRRERVTKEGVLAALRSEGAATVDDTMSVVIETVGTLSVLTSPPSSDSSSRLSNVHGFGG